MTKNRAAKQAIRTAQKLHGGRYTDHLAASDIWGEANFDLPDYLQGRRPNNDIDRFLFDWGVRDVDTTLVGHLMVTQNSIDYDDLVNWIGFGSEMADAIVKHFPWTNNPANEKIVVETLVDLLKPFQDMRDEFMSYQKRNTHVRAFNGVASGTLDYDVMKWTHTDKDKAETLDPKRIRFITEAFSHPAMQDSYVGAIAEGVASLYDVTLDAKYALKVMEAIPVEAVKYRPSYSVGRFYRSIRDFNSDVAVFDNVINGDRERAAPLGYVAINNRS